MGLADGGIGEKDGGSPLKLAQDGPLREYLCKNAFCVDTAGVFA